MKHFLPLILVALFTTGCAMTRTNDGWSFSLNPDEFAKNSATIIGGVEKLANLEQQHRVLKAELEQTEDQAKHDRLMEKVNKVTDQMTSLRESILNKIPAQQEQLSKIEEVVAVPEEDLEAPKPDTSVEN